MGKEVEDIIFMMVGIILYVDGRMVSGPASAIVLVIKNIRKHIDVFASQEAEKEKTCQKPYPVPT